MWLQNMFHGLRPLWRLYIPQQRFNAEAVPQAGSVILAANHASFIDPWFLAGLSPRLPVRYLVNEQWYRRSRVAMFLFDGCGVIPQSTRPAETIRRVVACLGAGDVVGIFPEGRISYDGKMTRAQHGIGWIAALSGVPVVPVGLRGNFDVLPRHKLFPRRARLEVRFGAPMRFPNAPCAAPDPGEVHSFVCEVVTQIARLASQDVDLAAVLPKAPAVDLRPLLGGSRAARDATPEQPA